MTSIGINNLAYTVVTNVSNTIKNLKESKPENRVQNFLNIFDGFTIKTKTNELSKVNYSFVDNKNKTINKDTKVLIIGDSQF